MKKVIAWVLAHKAFVIFLAVLVFLAAFSGRKVLVNTYFGSHDGDYMLIRAFVAKQMLAEGQFPLRWSGSLQYGCGAPVFTFFYPLFGYVVGGLSLLSGVSVVLLMKWLYWSFFLIGTLGFFLWAYRETKNAQASFLGGVLYLFAPYRFVLVFVRGSMEGLGYALLPWVLLAVNLVYERPRSASRWLFAAVIGVAFFLSHNLVVFFSLPIIGGYILYLSTSRGKLRWGAALITIWVGLTLFFWGPALLEQRYTKLPQQISDTLANLPSLKQLIYSPWGFGPVSAADVTRAYPTGISFSLGLGQWLMLAFAGVVVGWALLRKRAKAGILAIVMLVSLLLIFLDSNLSTFVWKAVPFLGIIQFPWRLLGFCVFFVAVAGVLALTFIKASWIKKFVILAVFTLSFINVRNYMGANPVIFPEVYADLGKHFFRHGTATVSDEILPVNQEKACAIGREWIEGAGITLVERKYHETGGVITFQSRNSGPVDLTLPLSYFPGLYQFKLNGKALNYIEREGYVFLPQSNLNAGLNGIEWQIGQTRIEATFFWISAASLLGVILFIIALLWYSSQVK